MKKVTMFLLGGVGLIWSGCTPIYVQPRPEPFPVESSPINKNTQVDRNAFSIDSEVRDKLRVMIFDNKKEFSFCKKLANTLASSVITDNSEIISSTPYDVAIFLDPEFELIDKDGEYYRINCEQLTVTIRSARKVYAVKVIEPKPLPRKLSIDKAKDQYIKSAAAEISPFLTAELEKIANYEIGVSEVGFNLQNVSEKADSADISENVEKISRILRSTPGIVNYTLLNQDINKAHCTFRIVYLKDDFRQGLTNVLNVKLTK